MFAWAWTLIRLYKDIKHSNKLLPSKGIFILHGSLLTGFLLLFAMEEILTNARNHADNLETYSILTGIYNIFAAILHLVELMTFFLVVKLMIPITPSDKEKRSKFQRFLFKGFADKN